MNISEDLHKLEEMHRRGALSDDEFSAAKARVLGDTGRAASNPALAAANALRRSRTDRWLGGVCGGLAQVTGSVAWIWRLILAALVLCAGTGVLVYLLLWILVPEEDARIDANRGQVQPG